MTSATDTMPESATATGPGASAVVRTYIVFAFLFLIAGLALLIVAFAVFAWPSLLDSLSGRQYLTYGRAMPMAINALVFGWLTLGLGAATLHFAPRLADRPVASSRLAGLALLLIAGGTGAGVAAIGAGDGVGGKLLEMPWYADAALTLGFLILAAVVSLTVRGTRIPVAGWYLVAAPWWLFLSYGAGAIPGLDGASAEIQSAFAATGVYGLWIVTAAVGSGYYLVARLIPDAEFHPRLGRIGFWSLAFTWAWTAGRTLQYGPTPDWMETIPVLFTAGLLVAVIAVVSDFSMALKGRWGRAMRSTSLQLFTAGTMLFLFVPGQMFVQSLRSSSAVVHLTAWETAFDLITVIGAFTLWVAAAVVHLLELSGRPWGSRAGRVVLLAIAGGSLFAAGTRWIAGLQQGYGWLAGVESGAYDNFGDGYINVVAPLHGTDVLTFIGVAVAAAGAVLLIAGASVRLGGGEDSSPAASWPDTETPSAIRRGAALIFAVAVLAVFVFPAIDSDAEPSLLADASRNHDPGSIEDVGRDLYVSEGCWYCHTQQVRGIVTDVGLGSVSTAGDYAYDPVGIFGVARSGPDLAHAGSREQTSDPAWVAGHLADPRASRPWSNMPSYDYLSSSDLDALAAYVAGLK